MNDRFMQLVRERMQLMLRVVGLRAAAKSVQAGTT